MVNSLLVGLAVLALTVNAAIAQMPGGTGAPSGSRGGLPPPRNIPPETARRSLEAPLSPGALVQVDLDQIEDDLKLTPVQLPAWRAYADKVQKLADDTSRSQIDARMSAPPRGNAIQQLEQIGGGIRGRATLIEEIVDASRALYAMLTPEQKVIADRRMSNSVSLLATGILPPGMSDGGNRAARRPGS